MQSCKYHKTHECQASKSIGLKRYSSRSKQRGIALVTVLVSISIITGLVSNLAYEQFIQSRRSALVLHREQAIMYLFAVEAYAKIVLNLDSLQNGVDWYGETEPWGRTINNNFEGGQIKAALIDLDGRFNLNNLRRIPSSKEINTGEQDINLKSDWHNCYLTLVTGVTQDISGIDNEALVAAVEDWLDPDVNERPKGVEDAYYQSPTDLRGSYKPANHLLGDVKELGLIKGYEQLFAEDNASKLLRQVSALPTTTATININTATVEVLACLEPNGRITPEIASRIATIRETIPFENVSELVTLLNNEYPVTEEVRRDGATDTKENISWNKLLPVRFLDVRSKFILVRAELNFGFANLIAHSWLQRTTDGSVRVLRRSFESS